MKIPSPVRTSRDAGNPALAYATAEGGNSDAFGGQIGGALSGLGRQIAASGAEIGAQLKQREDKTDRFTSLTNFSEFESEVSTHLTELKRQADPSGKGFAQLAEKSYDEMEADFLATRVAPELREEFKYRTSEVKRGLIGDVLDFQYKAGDAYFRQGISDELNKAQIALDKDPTQMDAWRKRIDETVNASDLSDIEKEDVRRKAYIGLEGVTYKSAIRENIKAGGGGTVTGPVGEIIDAAAAKYGVDPVAMRKIAWIESRGNPKAQNKGSSAGGLFQFIDSTAKDYGLSDKYDAAQNADAGARLMRDNAAHLQKVLGRAPTIGELYLAHQQGAGGASALLANPNRMAVDVVGRDAVIGNGGTTGMTAGEFANLWIKKADGAQTDFAGELDNDPRYANIPYEDRLALRRDAQTEANAALTQQMAADKANTQAQINALMNGIEDGTSGQKQIDDAYSSGLLRDYDDRMKAQNAYDKKVAEGATERDAITKLSTPMAVWDPTDENDKKMLNSAVNSKATTTGQSVLDGIRAGNADTVTGTLIPLVQQTHDIPTDVTGNLAAMVRSSSQARALFALDTLAQLQDADPRAYAQRTDEQLAKDVDLYRSLKDLVPTDELMGRINGGTDQESRTRTKMLREEATTILQTRTDGVSKLDSLVAAVVSDSFDPGTFSGEASKASWPAAALALNQEYQTLFIDEYSRTGNVDTANANVVKALKRSWAVTEVGTAGTLMKNPPEKFYPAVEGGYEWINRQLQEDVRGSAGPTGTFAGLAEAGNVDLTKRPKVAMPDGGFATVRSASFNIDGQEVLIPTVSPDGKLLSNQQALQLYKDTGQHLGKFDTPEHATAYAEALHKAQEQYYSADVGRVEIFSDGKTDEQARKMKNGSSELPTYRAIVYDSNGVAKEKMGPNGGILRYGFQVTELDKAKQVQHAVNLQKQADYEKFMREYNRAEEHQFSTGVAIPQDILDEKARLEKELDAEPDPKKYPSPYNPAVEEPIDRGPPSSKVVIQPSHRAPPADPGYPRRRSEHERVRAALKEGVR